MLRQMPSPQAFLWMHAPGLSKLISQVQMWGPNPLLLREKIWVVSSFLVMGCHTEGEVYGEIVSQSLCTS